MLRRQLRFVPRVIIMKNLTIATRGSALALWQANHIKSLLEAEHGITVTLSIIKTKGDIILDVPLAKVGGKGLFVKEIEEALMDGSADLAVHSMKDVPMELPEGLILAAVPVREDHADLMLSVKYGSLDELPQGAVVGTSSLRRQAQLLGLRPDLKIVSLRGNVDTRLRKLNEGQFDAIVMAAAGMKRLGLAAPKSFRLEPPAFLPAVGQGALGIECRADRQDVIDALKFLDDAVTREQAEAERGFSERLGGGCQAPIAATAYRTADGLLIDGLVSSLDGKTVIRRTLTAGQGQTPRDLGIALAEAVLADGGQPLLDEILNNAAAE